MRRARAILIGAGAVVVAAAVAACSSGGSTGQRAAGAASVPAFDAARPGAAHGATLESGSGAGSGSAASGDAGSSVALGTSKIRTAALTVQVAKPGDVDRAATKADGIAQRYGGEVYSDDRTEGRNATAVITVKVPPAHLPAVLAALAGLGKDRSRRSSTQDVTAQVVDVDTRVSNLRATISELQRLYDRPGQKLSDVLAVESDLNSRRADLESLEAQQRALQAETDTATVTLTLVTAAAPAPHHAKRGGFVGGLRAGWHAFTSGATWCARALGAAVPFAVLLIVVGAALRLLWSRLVPERRPTAPAEPAAE